MKKILSDIDPVQLARLAVERFSCRMPQPVSELRFGSEYELIVAVMLSAQCTDARVNKVTPVLFKRFPDFETLAKSDVDEIFEYVKSVSYPNSKALHLLQMSNMVVDRFSSALPHSVELLTTLPGVGAKTACVVASILWDIPVIPVDTHVFRVSARLGLTINAKTPDAARYQLESVFNTHGEYSLTTEDAVFNKSICKNIHHWLVLHGRYICKARVPMCNKCFLTDLCKAYNSKIFDFVKI